MISNRPLDVTKRMFYDKRKQFNNFSEITEEDFEKIRTRAKNFGDSVRNGKNHFYRLNPEVVHYQEVLEFLVSKESYTYFKSYDEKMLFLILSVDPELTIFKKFLATDIVPKTEIIHATPILAQRLTEQRQEQIQQFQLSIAAIKGFSDISIIPYESAYFKKFLA